MIGISGKFGEEGAQKDMEEDLRDFDNRKDLERSKDVNPRDRRMEPFNRICFPERKKGINMTSKINNLREKGSYT